MDIWIPIVVASILGIISIFLIVTTSLETFSSSLSANESEELERNISEARGWKDDVFTPLPKREEDGRDKCRLYNTFTSNLKIVDNLPPIIPNDETCFSRGNMILQRGGIECGADTCRGRNGRFYTRGEMEVIYAECTEYPICKEGNTAIVQNLRYSKGVLGDNTTCLDAVTEEGEICREVPLDRIFFDVTQEGADLSIEIWTGQRVNGRRIEIRKPMEDLCLDGNLKFSPCSYSEWFITEELEVRGEENIFFPRLIIVQNREPDPEELELNAMASIAQYGTRIINFWIKVRDRVEVEIRNPGSGRTTYSEDLGILRSLCRNSGDEFVQLWGEEYFNINEADRGRTFVSRGYTMRNAINGAVNYFASNGVGTFDVAYIDLSSMTLRPFSPCVRGRCYKDVRLYSYREWNAFL